MTRRFKGSILVLMIVLFTFSIVACGGGSSGDGTVSLSGIVLDPLEGSDPVPVGSALVGAYRLDDSTLIDSTTSAASGATGTFISSPPTVVRADTNDLPMIGAAVNSVASFGAYALSGSLSAGTLDEAQIDAPVIQGEITYFVWSEE